MALTLEDFLKVTQQQEETMKKTVKEELKNISSLIETTVKTEVEAAIKPLSDRQGELENKSDERFLSLESDIRDMKSVLAKLLRPRSFDLLVPVTFELWG